MKHRLLAPALLLGALVALSGCGEATGSSTAVADAASDPTGAASATASGAEPAWPADCTDHAMSQLDFNRPPQGWKTPEEAIAHATTSIPDGTVVVAPADATSDAVGTMTVWVVDDATGTILAAVHLTSTPGGSGAGGSGGGLYVDGVETCA